MRPLRIRLQQAWQDLDLQSYVIERDYYDLWRVLGNYWDRLDLIDFRARLHDKCRLRNVDFEGPEDFFDRRIVDDVERGWEDSLGPLITDLPSFARVMDELRPQVEALLIPEG